jgi:Tol biopolymer transport system component
MRDLATGKDTESIKLPQPGGLGGAPSWSTDGKFIAITVISPPPKGSTTVAIINPETGKRRDFFTRPGAFLADLTWLPDNSGLMMCGPEIGSALTNQLFLLSYPGAKLRRVSNDFNTYADITAGGHDVAIASMRSSVLANLYAIDAASGQSSMITSTGSPENSPFNLVTVAGRVYYSKLHGDYLGVGSISVTGGPEISYDTGEGHCVSIKGGENVLVVQRLDLDQQMHLWRMAPGGGMKQLTSGGGEDLLDVAPDGKWFTYGDIDSIKGIWIMSTDGGQGRLVAPNAQKALGGFSHDSKFIITLEYLSNAQGLIENQFKVVSIDGSAQPVVLKFPPRAADQENRVGTDTVSYIDGSDPNRNLFTLDIKGGKTTQLTHLAEGAITDHEWSPDGQRLAVVRRMADGENVWFLNTDGSQPREITHLAGQDIIQLLWADNTRLIVDAGQHSNDVVLVRDTK